MTILAMKKYTYYIYGTVSSGCLIFVLLPEKTEKGEKRQYICLAYRFFFVILQTHIISNMGYY